MEKQNKSEIDYVKLANAILNQEQNHKIDWNKKIDEWYAETSSYGITLDDIKIISDSFTCWEFYVPLAIEGNPIAQYFLSNLYKKYYENGRPVNTFWWRQAVKGLLPAAKAGNGIAQEFISELYENTQDYHRFTPWDTYWTEREWMLMAAKNGRVNAQYKLAQYYLSFYISYYRSDSYYRFDSEVPAHSVYKDECGKYHDEYGHEVTRRYRWDKIYEDKEGVFCLCHAIKWYSKAIKQEHKGAVDAIVTLVQESNEYMNREREKESRMSTYAYKEKEIEIIENAVWYQDAQGILGDIYANGIVVEKDYLQAVICYEKAGLTEKAKLYYKQVAEICLEKANPHHNQDNDVNNSNFNWYEKAANYGSEEASAKLVQYYCKHNDIDAAISYFEKLDNPAKVIESAKLIECIIKIAKHFLNNKDFEMAAAYYEKAALLGDTNSARQVAVVYSELGNQKKAVEWFEKIASQGNDLDWMWQLGERYADGNGIPQNDAKASEWLEKGAVGNEERLWKLANRYATGDGVDKNIEKAIELLEACAKQNNEDAIHKLAKLRESLGAFKVASMLYEKVGDVESALRCLKACE